MLFFVWRVKIMASYILRKIIRKLPGIVIRMIPIPKPEIIEGHSSRTKIGAICKAAGYSRVLLVTDKTLFSLGFHESIIESLASEGIEYTVFSDIASEPTSQIIEAGRQAALACDAECIVALGGGSVLDSCKMIAASAHLKMFSIRHLLLKFLFVPGKTLPLISVPSTAGTGAEMTVGAVVTNTRKKAKSSTVIIGLNVTHVILDSELTINAPAQVTAACGIDALSHGLEGVLADVKVAPEDALKSKECVKLVLENLSVVLANPQNIEARLSMCRAANYGGNAINKQLAGYVHAFAHSIGAQYHMAHGQAIALSLIPVLKFHQEKCANELSDLALYCGAATQDDNNEMAICKLIEAIAQLIRQSLVLPTNFILPEDKKNLIRLIVKDSINYSAPVVLSNQEISDLLDEINIFALQ